MELNEWRRRRDAIAKAALTIWT